ncbi:hypothetical protein NDU88_005793 [Pleurodeles waltl]|uniref:Uncharacterized protein n=1 Tax=Pleurodeles waltl TaxID=8319 RepID=A0AAV7MXR9_PLEWA|nr:hypothetical protein NDU88_005793 [Pleurodeles waltl]
MSSTGMVPNALPSLRCPGKVTPVDSLHSDQRHAQAASTIHCLLSGPMLSRLGSSELSLYPIRDSVFTCLCDAYLHRPSPVQPDHHSICHPQSERCPRQDYYQRRLPLTARQQLGLRGLTLSPAIQGTPHCSTRSPQRQP